MDEKTNCAKIKLLEQRMEAHFQTHREDEKYWNERQKKQELDHERSREAINKNIKALEELTASVKPLVDGITTFVTIQRFFKWCSGFAFLGVLVAWFTGINPFK